MPQSDRRVFLRRALRRPRIVSTPFVTGDRLARQLTRIVPEGCAGTVVELGAGAGTLSVLIRERLGSGARHLAVEIDEDLVAHLRAVKPWLDVVCADATDYHRLLDHAGIEKVDAVVSSLPWALMSRVVRRELLAAIGARLAPDGAFGTISTLLAPPGRVRAVRADLDSVFDEVVETATVWLNPPPARLFCATGRPDRGSGVPWHPRSPHVRGRVVGRIRENGVMNDATPQVEATWDDMVITWGGRDCDVGRRDPQQSVRGDPA